MKLSFELKKLVLLGAGCLVVSSFVLSSPPAASATEGSQKGKTVSSKQQHKQHAKKKNAQKHNKASQRSKAAEQKNKALVSKFYNEFWKKGNHAIADKVFAKNAIIHRPVPGFEGNPIEGLKQVGKQYMQGFSGGTGMAVGPIAEGDKVACYWEYNGKFTGKYMGVQGVGQIIHSSGMDMFRIKNGKIVEMWHEENLYEVMLQLGLIPMPTATPNS